MLVELLIEDKSGLCICLDGLQTSLQPFARRKQNNHPIAIVPVMSRSTYHLARCERVQKNIELESDSGDGSLSDDSPHPINSGSDVEYESVSEALIFPERNENLLRSFYNALAAGNIVLVRALLAHDLELWFHGQSCHQYMNKLLTGSTSFRSVSLTPSSILGKRERVFVEGQGPVGGVSWVHIWTVEDGRLVQLREYWNTAVLVTDIAPLRPPSGRVPFPSQQLQSVIWESKLWTAMDDTKPALILLI